VRVIYEHLSAVLTAAVDDGRIARNPCRAKSVKARRPEAHRVIPWSHDDVRRVRRALPGRYRLIATLAAGCGLRQGEAFGVADDDVDFADRVLHVRRQVKIVRSRLVFALPKGRKTRDVPLPDSVAEVIARHLERFPAVDVALPWQEPAGELVSARLIVTSRERAALNRTYFNTYLWKPALQAAGLELARENGMHALRHWFASVLLDGGESIKAVSEYLGHSDSGFTLRTYTHLMPSSEARMRKAVDRALGDGEGQADGPETAQEPRE
jgi:integrase